MPISKKARVRDISMISSYCVRDPRTHPPQVQREHKAAEKAGTRAPVKANGLPVKAPKPTSIVC